MKTRFGIIGPGNIANRFASVLNKTEGTVLHAVASRDLTRAQEFAAKHAAAIAFASYDELIADPAVDIVYIALTHNFHREAIEKCLNQGKPVICEKPLGINGREVEDLIALSREKGVLMMEAMWSRCLPAFAKAREWVASGRIGKVGLVDASFSFNIPDLPGHRLFDPKLAGGSLLDAGVYPIEFALGILDEAPVSAKGEASICATGVDDFAAMTLRFGSGALATLSCGFRANTRRDATVYGTEGSIIVYDFIGSKKCACFDKNGALLETFEEDFEDGFSYQIRHVCELVRDGMLESPLIPHKDTLACAKAFDVLLEQFAAQ